MTVKFAETFKVINSEDDLLGSARSVKIIATINHYKDNTIDPGDVVKDPTGFRWEAGALIGTNKINMLPLQLTNLKGNTIKIIDGTVYLVLEEEALLNLILPVRVKL